MFLSRIKRMEETDIIDYETYQISEMIGFGDFHPEAETVAYDWPTNRVNFGKGPVSQPNIDKVFCKSEADVSLDFTRRLSEQLRAIKCTPEPDAMNPCEDVMGNIGLRIIVWFVWLMAVVGNLLVFLALRLTWHNRGMEVHNFLMLNIAFADFLIGVYLAMLAVEDIRTAGQYYNYAVDWQTGIGCRMAGFLSVFASELCIYSMMLMSIEIFYKTHFAIHAKRITIGFAVVLVAIGWIVGLVFAILPLVGWSSYSATSTCLPLRMDSLGDQVYLILALGLNFVFFAGICGCYIALFCTVRDRSNSSVQAQDIALAKRMALLISTDFLCWAPTIFFGLTAVGGKPLISISIAKFFLVIFYPINSMTNPFIYVFFTKLFRKSVGRFLRHNQKLRRWYKPRNQRNRNLSTSTNSRSISTTVLSFFSTITANNTSSSNGQPSRSISVRGPSFASTGSSDTISSDRKRESTPNLRLFRGSSRTSRQGLRFSLSSNGTAGGAEEIVSPTSPVSPPLHPIIFEKNDIALQNIREDESNLSESVLNGDVDSVAVSSPTVIDRSLMEPVAAGNEKNSISLKEDYDHEISVNDEERVPLMLLNPLVHTRKKAISFNEPPLNQNNDKLK